MTNTVENCTLLIVDDETDLLEILNDLLSSLCPKIVCANSGKDALDLVMKGLRPDAILSDFNMPNIDGLKLLAELNALGLNTPFIFLSGYGSNSTIQGSHELGCYAFVEKPFDFKVLQNVVRGALELGLSIRNVESEMLKFQSNKQDPRYRSLQQTLADLLKFKHTQKKPILAG